MTAAVQLGLDLTPLAAFAVGDRVRVLPSAVNPILSFRAGDVGTVVEVRRQCGPGDMATWKPVCVMLDRWPERRLSYAFEHEDLEAAP